MFCHAAFGFAKDGAGGVATEVGALEYDGMVGAAMEGATGIAGAA